jgi:hypothetical protein
MWYRSYSQTAVLEEGLAKDAYWILTRFAIMASDVENSTDEIIIKINKMAEYCRVGSSDPQAFSLLD